MSDIAILLTIVFSSVITLGFGFVVLLGVMYFIVTIYASIMNHIFDSKEYIKMATN